MHKLRNKVIAVVAAFIFLYGFVAVLTARLPFLNGIHEAIGNHARGIGFVFIVFSIWIFFANIRHRKRE
jgi:divalent metal cation (Fe/Co/Zn/Cd) transporter